MKKIIVLMALVVGMLNLMGCNTVQGVGRDIENAGEAIQKAVKK